LPDGSAPVSDNPVGTSAGESADRLRQGRPRSGRTPLRGGRDPGPGAQVISVGATRMCSPSASSAAAGKPVSASAATRAPAAKCLGSFADRLACVFISLLSNVDASPTPRIEPGPGGLIRLSEAPWRESAWSAEHRPACRRVSPRRDRELGLEALVWHAGCCHHALDLHYATMAAGALPASSGIAHRRGGERGGRRGNARGTGSH
jgi:hypothetical protein